MSNRSDYDSPWKDILERFFTEFTEFFFPDVHTGIAWDKEQTFLDKEFQQIVRDSKMGRRLADKLVKVYSTDGTPLMVLVHVEVQGKYESNFTERMYVYNYRIYDRYSCPVVSLAVLADGSVSWRPSCFEHSRWGFRLQMDFPVAKLLDYNDMSDLQKNPNPFAVVVMAHLKTMETRHDNKQRYEWKWFLMLELYRRKYEKQDVIDLFLFIDWIMILPDELKRKFSQQVTAHEEEQKMKFISSVEELGIEKGEKRGEKRGEWGLLGSIGGLTQATYCF